MRRGSSFHFRGLKNNLTQSLNSAICMEVWWIESHLTLSSNLASRTAKFSNACICLIFVLSFNLHYFGGKSDIILFTTRGKLDKSQAQISLAADCKAVFVLAAWESGSWRESSQLPTLAEHSEQPANSLWECCNCSTKPLAAAEARPHPGVPVSLLLRWRTSRQLCLPSSPNVYDQGH